MSRFFIIADDVTGANDSGVQFAKRNFKTRVLFTMEKLEESGGQVLVVDTDSRSLPSQEAYRLVQQAVNRLRPQNGNNVFKKVDSTLRGNPGAEVQAVLDTLPGSRAFIVPAYPRNGRTTREGIHYLHGVPVHETEIGRDPKTPVTSSRISDLFPGSCSLVRLETVRQGLQALQAEITRAFADGFGSLVFDAQTDADLQAIARLYDLFPQAVWVGSAGIAEYLQIGLQPQTSRPPLPQLSKPMLFLVGSLSESTRQQVEAFVGAHVYQVSIDPLQLLTDQTKAAAGELSSLLADAKAAYRSGRHCVIALRADEKARAESAAYGRSKGLSSTAVSDLLRAELGKLAARLTGELQPDCLFLTGGDTARSVCQHLDIAGVEIIAELEPGIPLGQDLQGTLHLVTKAGAFGSRDVFSAIVDKLYG